MAYFRLCYKLLLFIALILSGVIISLIFFRNTMPIQGLICKISLYYHRLLIKVLGIKLQVFGHPANAGTLYVPNHISWLDISILGSVCPTHFISKYEVKNIPLIGLIAKRVGTIFIQRGGKNAAKQTNTQIEATLSQQHNVVLFAEGTTTNGQLRKFHPRLLQGAIDAKAAVQPVALVYPNGNGKQINPAVLYVGDTRFIDTIFLVLSQKTIQVNLHFLEPKITSEQTRNTLAQYCYEQIEQQLEQSLCLK